MNKSHLMAMALSFGLVGCGDPVVGDWSGMIEAEGSEITVDATFDGDGTGTMTMEVSANGITVEIDFETEWEKTSKGEYEIEATCVDIDPEIPAAGLTCDEFDTGNLECTLSSNKDKMTCADEDGAPVVLEAE
jgi:hypothetical protein